MPPELLAAIDTIAALPGIGRRSAMRIVFDLIRQGAPRVRALSESLTKLVLHVSTCTRCGAYVSRREGENEFCQFCDGSRRESDTLCIVENPSDVYAVENTGEHSGLYHVLGGVLSPLDGVGPEELKMPELKVRVLALKVREVIVAANPSVEGNATGHYVADMLKPEGVRVTRIATGLALGQMLDFAETQAISQSLKARIDL